MLNHVNAIRESAAGVKLSGIWYYLPDELQQIATAFAERCKASAKEFTL